METCRFAAPWSIEELAECFIVRVRQRAGVGYFYYDDEEHRRAVNKHLTKDTARRTGKILPSCPTLLSANVLESGRGLAA